MHSFNIFQQHEGNTYFEAPPKERNGGQLSTCQGFTAAWLLAVFLDNKLLYGVIFLILSFFLHYSLAQNSAVRLLRCVCTYSNLSFFSQKCTKDRGALFLAYLRSIRTVDSASNIFFLSGSSPS